MEKPHCYGAMDWVLKYAEDKIPDEYICKCNYTNSCLRLTNNKRVDNSKNERRLDK